MGSALTNPGLKRNNFKERLHMIERLMGRINQQESKNTRHDY